MKIVNLYSGSKGNSTLVMTNKVNLLIDVGLSMKKINQALMITNGIDLDDINIVLLTHAHTDHVSATNTIINKYPHIKFITHRDVFNETKETLKKDISDENFIFIDKMIKGNDIDIDLFPLNHDKTCFGFAISEHLTKESYMFISDNGGLYDKNIIERHKNHTYYSIESNFDLTLQVNDTKRHEGLKRRVLGYYGHTSNYESMQLAFKLIGENTKSIQFHHLSEDCNSEELIKETHDNLISIWGHKKEFKNINVTYARQHESVKL